MKASKAETTTFFVSLAIVSIMSWFIVRYIAQGPSHTIKSTQVAEVVATVPPPPTFAVTTQQETAVVVSTTTTEATQSQSTIQKHRDGANGPRSYADAGAKTAMNNFLWGVFPYLCIVLFFIVPIIRMATRPYSWSTRASGLFGRQLLGVASTMFHWGLVLLLAGHVVGLIGGVMGSRSAVDFFFWSALIGGFLVLVGCFMALMRRIRVPEVRAMSRPEDYIIQCLLLAIVGIALYQVVVDKIFGITYTASSWAASLWTLTPQPELMESASFLTKLHVFLALVFFAYFPFTKLVHFWTFPVNYFVRVPQSMRTQKYRFQRKWEFALRSDKSWLVYGLGIVAVGFLVSGGLLGSPTSATASDVPTSVASPEGDVLAGYPLYISQCARCHGENGYGDGAGMDSPTFSALPRNFVADGERNATYHFVSTDNGVASDDDLFRVIAEGLDGSGMPAFPDLTVTQIVSLVDVLNEFRAAGPKAGNPIHVAEAPDATQASVGRGAELFAANCASCHGADGSGSGDQIKYSWRETAPEMFQVIPAANLANGEIKFGSSAEDIFTRITTGIPGGASGSELMMSFDSMSEEDRWAIVHYVIEEILPSN
ncbi:MAG: respiratory nitrate reductase subunit gamma [Planctomycetes bacterium]|nr:respiratory nitrate reductase subunit gamma [Planctomycetota bacterium]